MGSKLAMKGRCSMKMRRKALLTTLLTIAIVMVFFIALIMWWAYDNFLFAASPSYNNAMYSVVIYNETDQVVRNVSVSYGEGENIVEFTKIPTLEPQQHRKVNIPTNDLPIPAPYNVSIRIETDAGTEVLKNGYFGTGTGGFDVAVITMSDGTVVLDCLPDEDKMFKKLYRRHLKNQEEESW